MTSTRARYNSRSTKSTPPVIAEVDDIVMVDVNKLEDIDLDGETDVDKPDSETELESALDEAEQAMVELEQPSTALSIEVPPFEDAVDGMHFCNQELAELLLQLMKSNHPRLERSIRSLLGGELGNQWLAQVNGLLGHRDALSKAMVQQIMRGSMRIRL